MKNLLLFSFLFVVLKLDAQSQDKSVPANLPDAIYSGKQGKFHVQGVAVDQKKGFVYFSFTDKLIKMDLKGNLVGSVTGFVGHLGDLDIAEDGRIYGSLEYKNDAIGKNISKSLGEQNPPKNGFYIAIFDGSQIIRPNMTAEKEDLLRTVYIKEAVKDYEASVQDRNETKPHRFACSGIDGITFGPAPGSPNPEKKYLYIAYGIYGDTTRADNNHQVLLQYDISNWDKYGQGLSQNQLHQSGPAKPMEKYFVKTGNTRYGIQNLAYDPYTGNFFAAVYRGAKSQFPNYDLFVIDAHQKPVNDQISSGNQKIKVKILSLLQAGPKDSATGISGWHFEWGATGLHPLGNGLFYISHNEKDKAGQEQSTVHKYKWVGDMDNAFLLMK
ncbi:hypothetical protein [Pedobacter psychroterrae]|uniref:Uncharacterized protein n=1 Tax=Pedobacter psychroterrae TaxID=2530453 RepID=A0A4R0NW23_9SPHI|nr:hypothetical protein [Pedobacter psychroterrae]TCD03234.1 hypothetical protein EZ437_04480 [Pedobacter psychroterrae]